MGGIPKCTYFLLFYTTTLFAHFEKEREKVFALFGCEACAFAYVGHEVDLEVLQTEGGAWLSFVVVIGYTIFIVLYFGLTDVVGS